VSDTSDFDGNEQEDSSEFNEDGEIFVDAVDDEGGATQDQHEVDKIGETEGEGRT
jgi:hypothetical protein